MRFALVRQEPAATAARCQHQDPRPAYWRDKGVASLSCVHQASLNALHLSPAPSPSLARTHGGFSLNAGEKPVAPNDVEGRRRLAEYLLRAPFSLEKITWNESTGKVIYRSKRSWHTKRNFRIFEAVDFLAATVEHIPPKGQQMVRYYGLYSKKSRGMAAKNGRRRPDMEEAKRPEKTEVLPPGTLFILPAPEPRSGRALRPLWRDLIMRVWGEDPHKCPCCPGTMLVVGTMIRRSEVEFFLRLHGLWEWKRSGHRLPNGSPKGGAPATSTNHRFAASARTAL